MSEKAEGGGGGGGGEDDDDSEGIEDKPGLVHVRRRQRMGGGCMRARTLLLRPIKRLQARKERNQQQQRQRRPPSPPSRPPYDEDFVATGCHLCFMPPTRHHPNRNASSDGSKPPSYHDFLRSLLEKNDFYSRDCNVHREVP